eukprot:TRINITY_DN1264_c0_g2_i1.p1 TRINITY_DN1264_c0_g2~~TRINITY_DN1264_c0_g2_i1.p1  ORF type:complete len:641 (+),score=103.69 TRINITY_DN1264_c0_g2_i1:165-1925(+)
MVLDQDYEVFGALGEGTFGKVYKAQHKWTGDEVAVKQIKLGARCWDEACKSMELQALTALRHPFIVRLRELIRSQWDGSLYYIFEFVDSDLSRVVKANPNGLVEPRTAELARQLFAGLAHMHHHNFFHRDLKPENVLFDSARQTIRIADLGQARSLRARPPFTDYVGTRWYRAPECLLRDPTYSSPVDVWASGLIIAELLRGSTLFCGASSIDQLYKIFAVLGQPLGDWPEFARLAQAVRFRVPERGGCGLQYILPRASPQAQAFLTEVLTLYPRRRPPARTCMEHAFFLQLPPLDIERLDTHRSRVSSGPVEREEKDSEYNGGGGSTTEQEVTGSVSSQFVELPTDIEELDAELDKILGGSTAAASSFRGSVDLSFLDAGDVIGDFNSDASVGEVAVAASSGARAQPITTRSPAAAAADRPELAPSGLCGSSAEETQEFGISATPSSPSSRPPPRASYSSASTADERGGAVLPRAWSQDEVLRLRRAVKRASRRKQRDKASIWAEVSTELGGVRGPRECRLRYGLECRAVEASAAPIVSWYSAWTPEVEPRTLIVTATSLEGGGDTRQLELRPVAEQRALDALVA